MGNFKYSEKEIKIEKGQTCGAFWKSCLSLLLYANKRWIISRQSSVIPSTIIESYKRSICHKISNETLLQTRTYSTIQRRQLLVSGRCRGGQEPINIFSLHQSLDM